MDPFVAEIRIFPFNFAPNGWAMCNGQILPISQNTALFALIGTFYGGNGTSNFALPNFQGVVPVHAGQGPGLSQRFIGESSGEEDVTLLATELPAHNHQLKAFVGRGADNLNAPSAGDSLTTSLGGDVYVTSNPVSGQILNPNTLSPAGGNQPHNNLMPYLTLNFCIALVGIFPARS
jgi:microcystin-dependent protein